MTQDDPFPSPIPCVFIGQNSAGHWVAQQARGLFGGLFVRRADAVRYALFENGHHAEAIVDVAGLELDMGSAPIAALPATDTSVHRRVA